MAASVLSERHFHDEAAAYKFVEARIWPEGPTCPHCGNADVAKIGKLAGKSTRIGVHKCYACRKPFTVKVGTIFESSHVALHLWLQAIFLLASSKKGISANQLHRTLGVTLKTAWFMAHRIREAMREGGLGPLGGEGKIVEADETYFGSKSEPQPEIRKTTGRPYKKRKGLSTKRAVLGLVERGGSVRTFHIEQATKVNVASLVTANVRAESHLMTDESRLYTGMDQVFARTALPTIARANMPCPAASTPTPSKAISACSSAVCAAPISTVMRSTCIGIWRSLISATTGA